VKETIGRTDQACKLLYICVINQVLSRMAALFLLCSGLTIIATKKH